MIVGLSKALGLYSSHFRLIIYVCIVWEHSLWGLDRSVTLKLSVYVVSLFYRKHVAGGHLKKKALQLYEALREEHNYTADFTCSDGWLDKFKRRNGVSVRKITGTAQKIPSIAPTLAAVFFNDIGSAIKAKGKLNVVTARFIMLGHCVVVKMEYHDEELLTWGYVALF